MKLIINGSPAEVADAATVGDVVLDVAGTERSRGVAVAVNDDVVSRSAWSTTTLADGDSVEILTAVQGG